MALLWCFCVVLLLAALSPAVMAAVSSEAMQTLEDLYDSTNGDQWDTTALAQNLARYGKTAAWDFSKGASGDYVKLDEVCGSWMGLYCAGSVTENGVVVDAITHIVMNSGNLQGALPASISKLAYVTGLYLYSNSLTGTIPKELGALTSMTKLLLHENSLTGIIPKELGALTSMTQL